MRSDFKIGKIFYTTAPANIDRVRGTADQVAAAAAWMTSHNALFNSGMGAPHPGDLALKRFQEIDNVLLRSGRQCLESRYHAIRLGPRA